MSKQLDDMATTVAEDQAAIEGQGEDTRARVIHMGKELRKMQKLQKQEQADTGQTWKEWCEEQKGARGAFPSPQHCRKYTLISRYPGAYYKYMSIREAYRQAGLWKKNGGSPPDKEKKTSTRPLVVIGKTAGQLERRIETLTDEIADSDSATYAQEAKWDDDEIAGAREALDDARKACNMLIRQLDAIYEKA